MAGKKLPHAQQIESLLAVKHAAGQLGRKGIRGGTPVWANVTAKFRGKTVIDDDRMKVLVRHDGGSTGQIALFWNDYVDDTDPDDRARMQALGLYGQVDHQWQRIKFVRPNTLYVEDPGVGYEYDVTLTFEGA